MTGLNILLWTMAVALMLMIAIVAGSLIYGLIKFNSRRSRINYDRVENALSKRDTEKRR